MNIIKNNPFRILGLPANSSERELQKRIAIVKRFADVGKNKEFDYDFSFFGDFSRTVDTVQEASNRIEQMPKKIQNALFWFTNNNRIDETALNYLKDNNIEKAIEIWQKTLKDEITGNNYSSYANLSTLLIGMSSVNGNVKKDLLKQGIELKGKFLNSDNITDFISEISRNGHICNSDKLNSEFTTEILQLVNPYLKNKDLTQREITSYFSEFPSNIQKSVSAKFSETHIFNIEKNIEETIKKRGETPRHAEKHGKKLYKNTKKDVTELKTIFGKENIQFQMIASKLANEIMQCAIEFYNIHRDDNTEFDPGNDALQITKYAKSIGATGQVKNRIIENTLPIQEWVDSKQEREKQDAIKIELKFITEQLIAFQKKSDTINTARNLVTYCKEKLISIKEKFGENDETYLGLSTAIANNAQGMIISCVNTAMNKRTKYVEYLNSKNDPYAYRRHANQQLTGNPITDFLNSTDYAPEYSIEQLKTVIKEAWSVTKLIGSLDILHEQKDNYIKNKNSLKALAEQLNIPTSVGQHIQKATDGCYIATMVYKDYNHPQVLVLRQFRDQKLSKTFIGRGFISFYYATSPKLVSLLKNNKLINQLIKSILEKIILKIK